MRRSQILLLLSLSLLLPACLGSSDPDPGDETEALDRLPRRVCTPGQTWACYSAPIDTDYVGVCHRGVKTCSADGMSWGACEGEVVPSAELCNDLDDDCDGITDESCTCEPGAESACYDGPAGTEGVGTCAGGTHVCNADGVGQTACEGSILPVKEVCGDGLDNDCDGSVDQGCVCFPNEGWDCYTAPLETDGIGACHRGVQTCAPDGFSEGACVGEVTPVAELCDNAIDDDCDGDTDEGCAPCVPTAEVCGDGLDNDCDGTADDGCVCAPGATQGCYGGPAGTAGIGVCAAGTATCAADGSGYGACVGAVLPGAEVCGDGLDNDCDGVADEGCVCAPGATAACYGGPAGTEGVGVCAPGTMTCNAAGTGYGACSGAILPGAELCGNGLDDDCDGVADDGCVCVPGSTNACYDGPPGTAGVGVCAAGVETCNAIGTGYGACTGAVGPSAETCGDGLDNDCDGATDEGCVCAPGSTAACYDGPAGTEGVGTCSAGTMTCNADGTGYGACVGSTLPGAEVCGDGLDTDCDGLTDETCVCAPASSQSCYGGPAGTAGVGVCHAGARVCAADGSGYGACIGAALPGIEVCGNNLDDDCDGLTDEGCLGDRAWIDRNQNGVQDAGENGLLGAIFLLRGGFTGSLIAVTTSNAAGTYWFSGVPTGTYYVEVVLPVGFGLSSMDAGPDNLDSDFDGEVGATFPFAFSGTGTNDTIDCGAYSTGGN